MTGILGSFLPIEDDDVALLAQRKEEYGERQKIDRQIGNVLIYEIVLGNVYHSHSHLKSQQVA